VKFIDEDGRLKVEDFRRAVDVMVLAMDITCSFSDLPTPAIQRNTRELRQLGLGYSNLGAYLMRRGLAYDSEEGRDAAAAVTAALTGRAYCRSARIAEVMGAYERFEENREAHLAVIEKHVAALDDRVGVSVGVDSFWTVAEGDWECARRRGAEHGFRNSQVTVLMPAGTTSYMMDCDTTGIEPPFSLITHKGLAGGGSMTIVNQSARAALIKLGMVKDSWQPDEYTNINWILNQYVSEDQRSVFATASEISPEGHVKMVAALQPFLSGAPSKTVNLPEEATVEDVRAVYELAWKLGCKCISLFRAGSKVTSILSSKPKQAQQDTLAQVKEIPTMEEHGAPTEPFRRKLPSDRDGRTHKMRIEDHKAYLTHNRYDEGGLGEIFLTGAGKEGSFLNGMMGAFSTAISIGLQYGVPLEVFAQKFIGMEFAPKGQTANHEIPDAKSFIDYIFKLLAAEYLDADECEALGVLTKEVKQRMAARLDAQEIAAQGTAFQEWKKSQPGSIIELTGEIKGKSTLAGSIMGTKPCQCGGLMVASGSCYTCSSCGENTGCG
jgi:ribonucleoside-diphosphate reductase alpha chain